MVQIEILNATRETIRAVFYYPLPQPVDQAADPNRQPAGSRLSAQEITALRNGQLIEWIVEFPLNPEAPVNQARVLLEGQYLVQEKMAKKAFRERWVNRQFIGFAWDGTDWTAAP